MKKSHRNLIGFIITTNAIAICGFALLFILFTNGWTRYSSGYSESAFQSLPVGMAREAVIRKLGEPLGSHEVTAGVIRWYGPTGAYVDEIGALSVPSGDYTNAAIIQFDLDGQRVLPFNSFSGQSVDEVQAKLGKPIKEEVRRSVVFLHFTESRGDGSYKRRWIGFDPDNKLAEKESYFWRD